MATNETTPLEQGSSSEDQLECSICSNRYKQPKALDCSHSFCLKCLQELKQHQDPETATLTCPMCRKETMLLKEVADLPDNLPLQVRVEEVTLQEQLMEGQGSKIKCQACDDKNQAISRCMDCKNFLCHECQKAHKRLAALKSHKIYTLAQLQAGEIGQDSKVNVDVPKCSKHSDQDLSIFCDTCEQLVCRTCSEQDHETQKHTLTDPDEALHRFKQNIAEMAAKVEINKSKLTIAMIETDKSQKKLDAMFADTKKKISQKVDKEVTRIKEQSARIEEEEKKLKEEVEKVYDDRVKTFKIAQTTNNQNITQAEQKIEMVNQLMAQGSCYEILGLKQKLMHILTELTKKEPEKVPDRLALMDFQEGLTSLGTLILEGESLVEFQARVMRSGAPSPREKWKLTKEVKTFSYPEEGQERGFKCAHDVSKFSTDEVVTTDIKRKVLVHISNIDSTYKYYISTEMKVRDMHVSHTSVNKNDQIITLDTQSQNSVTVLNKEYQRLHDFNVRGYGQSCLAVDDNNLIAVGNSNQISLRTPNGSPNRSLSAPMIDDYLTIHKQRLIYTNWGEKKLLAVDYSGNTVLSVDVPCKESWWGPSGVCCDGDGNIYVAVSGKWPSVGEILQFSAEGEYLGCIIEVSSTPRGMTFTHGGKYLVVAAGESVKIFQRA